MFLYCNTKFSDVAFGINDIDMNLLLDWYGDWDDYEGEDFNLCWKEYSVEYIEMILGKRIKEVDPLMADPMNIFKKTGLLLFNGVSFKVDNATLSICNALDCNGIEIECLL